MARYCGSSPTVKQCLSCPYEDCINDNVKPERDWKKPEYLAANKRRIAKRKAEWKAQGLCSTCGKRKPQEGFRTCDVCREYYRRKGKEYNRAKGILPKELLDGVERCYKCGALLNGNGSKMCERCLKQALKALSVTPAWNGKRPDTYFAKGNELYWSARQNQGNA